MFVIISTLMGFGVYVTNNHFHTQTEGVVKVCMSMINCRYCWFLVQLEGLGSLLYKLARFAVLLSLLLQGTFFYTPLSTL